MMWYIHQRITSDIRDIYEYHKIGNNPASFALSDTGAYSGVLHHAVELTGRSVGAPGPHRTARCRHRYRICSIDQSEQTGSLAQIHTFRRTAAQTGCSG